MSKINTIELSHCIQRAEALIQVLGEAVLQNGDTHHVIMIEVIEEYLLRARKSIENN